MSVTHSSGKNAHAMQSFSLLVPENESYSVFLLRKYAVLTADRAAGGSHSARLVFYAEL